MTARGWDACKSVPPSRSGEGEIRHARAPPRLADDIKHSLTVRSAGGSTVGHGGQLAFPIDTTGVAQVWRLDGAQAWPAQLSFHEGHV